ncbi:hypothetical protein [Variovorax sp. W2I14]|uniref:hypothetical protein n=1 Tax=Variovorax sp. W2I14 TaxID=3042290 RepID=UPI003D1F997F
MPGGKKAGLRNYSVRRSSPRSTRVVRLSDMGQAFLRDCAEVVGRFASLLHEFRTTRWMVPAPATFSRG